MKIDDLSGEPMVHYAHQQDPAGPRFRQYAKDKVPAWAVDVQPGTPNEKLSGGTPSVQVPCSDCGGTGQDDPPPGKYHGLCPKCGGSGKQYKEIN